MDPNGPSFGEGSAQGAHKMLHWPAFHASDLVRFASWSAQGVRQMLHWLAFRASDAHPILFTSLLGAHRVRTKCCTGQHSVRPTLFASLLDSLRCLERTGCARDAAKYNGPCFRSSSHRHWQPTCVAQPLAR